MGNSSSASWHTSPRLIQANAEAVKREKELGEKQTNLLDSPALLDLEHGTVRYRAAEHCPSEEVRQGYFYHAQLNDWSDPSSIQEFQKKHITEPPRKHLESKVFYVYAKGTDSETKDRGLRKVPKKPSGVGYRWRGTSDHLYFRLRFSAIRDDEGSDSETEDNGQTVIHRLKSSEDELALTLSQYLGLKYLVPTERVHIIYKVIRLTPETTLSSLTKHLAKFRVELKKLSDVEIVRHNFDKDETDRLKPEAGPDTLEQVYAEGGHAEGGHVEGVVEERDLDGELIAVHPVSDKSKGETAADETEEEGVGAVDGDKISTATEQDMEYDDTELSPVDKETLEHVQSTDIRAKSPVIKLGADKPILDRVKSPSEHGRVKSPSEHDRVKSSSEHGRVKSPSEHGRVKSPSEHGRVKSPSEHDRVKSSSEHGRVKSPSEHGRVKSPSEHDRVKSPSEHGRVKLPSEHDRVKSPSEHDRVKSPSEHDRVKSPSEQRLLDQDNESLSSGYLPGLVHE